MCIFWGQMGFGLFSLHLPFWLIVQLIKLDISRPHGIHLDDDFGFYAKLVLEILIISV